ncbi:Thiosulfate reductase cytochrome B subunit PhsC [wastewater metagenome]|uniref:Thiosulfate reductase cytochrome B subunit PhsC n=3 Tax=root TaxID=1 RepID=A0A5B8RAE5_9ZZZZ|nr:thiosulfate reductase cytochrome B subunit PhsC [uncultured organism]
MTRAMIYTRFERFWHWSQAVLILSLLFTGFEVHGSYSVLGFGAAARAHTFAAWLLVALWVFVIFWFAVTGEWRQFLPTTDRLGAVIRYYLVGTFTGEPHPFRRTTRAKHNPLQRLTYLVLKLAITPLVWGSGLLYLFYNRWAHTGFAGLELGAVALVHTAAAFLMLAFVIAHVYMATMGRTIFSLLKPMITGYEDPER